jgi:hypothetical protein
MITSLYSCNGISQYDSNICGGNGYCIEDICQCNFGFFGHNCQLTSCYGVISTNNNSCSSNGACMGYNLCICNNGYYGNNCTQFTCDSIPVTSNNDKLCNGRGKCVSYNKCECSSTLFNGQYCENASNLIALTVSLSLVFLFCLFCIISIIIIITIMSIIIISIIIYANKTKKKILKINKELQDKLFLMNDLNKINFNQIKFDKTNGKQVILGKGATSIVNKII